MSDYDEDEYNDDYSGNDYDQPDDNDDGLNLEDNFIVAESSDDPISAYKMIIDLELSNSDERKWSYKSYEKICQIYIKQKNFDLFKENFIKLLELYSKVDDIEKQDTVRDIGIICHELKDIDFSQKIYLEMMKQFRESEFERDYLDTSLAFSKNLLNRNDFKALKELLPELLDYFSRLEETDSNNAIKLEFLVMKIEVLKEDNKINEIKPVYRECIKLMKDQTFEDKRLTAIINEEGGKMNFRQMEYDKALQKFKLSFHNYKEVGINSAISSLKYAFLASMMSRNKSAIVSPDEAKIYKNDQNLMNLVELFEAYEEMNIQKIYNIWTEKIKKLEKDIFITENLDEIIHHIRLNFIINKLKSFDSCKIESLTKEVSVDKKALIPLIFQISSENPELDIKLDLINNIVITNFNHMNEANLYQNYCSCFNLLK